MDTTSYLLVGLTGAALGAAGLAVYLRRKAAYATPPVQMVPGTLAVTLQDGVTATLIVPVDKAFMIYLPSGGKWVSLKNEAGTALTVPSTGGAVNLPAMTDLLTGIWLDSAGGAHQGAVSVTVQAPPSGA